MINFNLYDIKLDCAFEISWKKSTAYAKARKFDALSYRINGSALYRHGDKEYSVNKNDIVFIPKGYDYTITANKSEDVLVAHFYLENSNLDEISVFTPKNPDVFERYFYEMAKVWRTKSTGYRNKLEIQEEQQNALLKPKKLQLALDCLHESFNSPQTTVESIAKYAGVSTVYLRRLFKKTFGKNPLSYLNDMRIEHAISLLKTGYYSIQDVATLSGFNDAKYFSTLYKAKIGKPPSEDLNTIN